MSNGIRNQSLRNSTGRFWSKRGGTDGGCRVEGRLTEGNIRLEYLSSGDAYLDWGGS